jgi:hypothetical protein
MSSVFEKWVVLWSPSLGGLHYETVQTMLEKNQLAFTKGIDPGYVVIQIVNNSREASEAVREAKAWKRERRNMDIKNEPIQGATENEPQIKAFNICERVPHIERSVLEALQQASEKLEAIGVADSDETFKKIRSVLEELA